MLGGFHIASGLLFLLLEPMSTEWKGRKWTSALLNLLLWHLRASFSRTEEIAESMLDAVFYCRNGDRSTAIVEIF